MQLFNGFRVAAAGPRRIHILIIILNKWVSLHFYRIMSYFGLGQVRVKECLTRLDTQRLEIGEKYCENTKTPATLYSTHDTDKIIYILKYSWNIFKEFSNL